MSDQRFFSDQSWLLFSLDLAAEISKPLRDPRIIDCRKFSVVIKNKRTGVQTSKNGAKDELPLKSRAVLNTAKNIATIEE